MEDGSRERSITTIAWFFIVIGIFLGIAQTLITLAMYVLGLGLVLLFGAAFYRSNYGGD